MSAKYIIIQKKKLKVPLLAGDGTWDVNVGEKLYCIDIFMEALFASLIFDPWRGQLKEIRHYISDRYNKYATPVDVDNFVKTFKESHRMVHLEDDSEVQAMGNDSKGCCIPIYKYVEAITLEEEKMLLKMVLESKEIPFEKLFHFFLGHLEEYDTCFYPKWGANIEAETIAINFLRMHGFHTNEIEEHNYRIGNGKEYKLATSGNESILITSCVIVEILIIAVSAFFGLFDGITKWAVYFVMLFPAMTIFGAAKKLRKKRREGKSELYKNREDTATVMYVSLLVGTLLIFCGDFAPKIACVLLFICALVFVCSLIRLIHLCLLSNNKYKAFHVAKGFKLLKAATILTVALLFIWVATLVYPMFFPPIEYYFGK